METPGLAQKRPAFTLIELMIVLVIIAIITTALVLSYQQLNLKVRYDTHVNNIVRIFQEARSRSLSTVLIEGTEPTEYYLLALNNYGIELIAYSENLEQVIEVYDFDEDIEISDEWEVYYFPPSGDLCFGSANCAGNTIELSTVLEDDSGSYSTRFRMELNGPHLEVR